MILHRAQLALRVLTKEETTPTVALQMLAFSLKAMETAFCAFSAAANC
jgi:hypothetical protein